MTAVLERILTPAEESELRRAAFTREADDPKKVADTLRWEEQKRRAAEWATANYGHNDRLNQARLRELHARFPVRPGFELPAPPKVERTIVHLPVSRYDVSSRSQQKPRRQEGLIKLFAPIVRRLRRVGKLSPANA